MKEREEKVYHAFPRIGGGDPLYEKLRIPILGFSPHRRG